jgi:hypothetical protein
MKVNRTELLGLDPASGWERKVPSAFRYGLKNDICGFEDTRNKNDPGATLFVFPLASGKAACAT